MDASDDVGRIDRSALLVTSLLVLVLLAPVGCVQRTLVIESTPPGARVLLDGEEIGATPVRVPFVYYGTRRLDLWLDRPDEDYSRLTEWVELRPAWYERFPLDLFTELLWPFPRTVERRHHAVLTRHEPAGPEDTERLLTDAEAIRRSTR